MLTSPPPLPDRLRTRTFVQHTFEQPKVKCSNDRPLSTKPTETSVMTSFMMGHWWWMLSNMLRTVWSHGTFTQHGANRIRSLNWQVTCSARNLDNNSGINASGGNIHLIWNFHRWFKACNQKAPEGKFFQSVITLTLIFIWGNQQIHL